MYAGTTSEADGTDVFLEGPRLRQSVNYKLLDQGQAYPLYYNTLFAELRAVLTVAVIRAWENSRGVWNVDRTMSGVTFSGPNSLSTMQPIFPKLWRRLGAWARQSNSLGGFLTWIATEKREELNTMPDKRDLQFEDVLRVTGNRIKMLYWPEEMTIRSSG